jgi:arylsulfatase A-like enzyme
MLMAVVLFRWAAWALAVIQQEPQKRSFAMSLLAVWAAASSVGLSMFGSILHSGTHHRGLGGATFGLAGAIAVAVCGIVVVRAGEPMRRFLERRSIAWAVVVASAVIALVATRAATRAPVGADPSPVAVAAWDALAALLMAAFASRTRIPWPYSKLATPASSGLFVLLVAIGMTVAPGVARAHSSAASTTPLLALLLRMVRTPIDTPAASPIPSASAAASVSSGVREPRPVSSDGTDSARSGGKGTEKADIIVVSLDSVRADHIGVYGYKRPTSIKLDAFATQASIFERAYAAGPETRTAIAPLATGKYLEQCARDDRPWPTLLDSEETIAERLQKAGYATAAVVSFQWLSKERGFGQGFDLYDESPFRKVHPEKWATSAHAIAQAIRAYDELAKKQRPIFLWVHLFDAHQKYLEHAEFDFGPKDIDRYDAEVAFQDQQLARLFERVQAGSRSGKTVWIVHGTHGEAFAEHGLKGHPPAGFDEMVRIPMIVRLPWGTPRRVTDPVSTIDIVPTLLDLAGVKAPGLPGQSFRELAEGSPPAEDGPSGVLVSYAGIPGTRERDQLRVWIMPPNKLVVQGAATNARLSLFDFATDPEEKQDAASTRGEDVKKLRQSMDAFVSSRLTGLKNPTETDKD